MFTKLSVSHAVSILLVVLLAVSVTTTLTLAQAPTGTGQELAPLVNAGTAFTYQGQLKNGGSVVNSACDFQFGLWDALTLGAQVGVTQTVSTVSVANGLFTTPLDFGANSFNGQARWLATTVRCSAGTGSYTPLTPRQPLTPAPMALALPGLYTQQNATSPNIIGGYSGNVISPTVVGGTIGGGGSINVVNRVQADYATVGGGDGNTAMGNYDTIGGGYINSASNEVATVSGGYYNTASGYIATVGGGQANTASGVRATVGGGYINIASGNYATVPGGSFNTALGAYSFAAGRRAQVNHQGAFVWGDSTAADVSSTGDNQFVIRASGGVRIFGSGTPPAAQLTVAGLISTTGGVKFPDGTLQLTAATKTAYKNLIVVAKSGGDFVTISAALTSITDNSAANHYLVYVAPGTYTETVTMKPFADIEGAGELTTKITYAGSASLATGTVMGANNAELRFLTVENTGGATYATAIFNSSAAPRLTHVTASTSGGTYSIGVFNDASSSPAMTDVTASASGGTFNYGVYNNSTSSPRMTNVTASASGGTEDYGLTNSSSSPTINNSVISGSGGTNNYGIYNAASSGAYTVQVNNSQISGATNTILNSALFTTRVGASQLSGGAVSGGGTVSCIGVYDEDYASPGYTICP